MKLTIFVFAICLVGVPTLFAGTVAPSWAHPPHQQKQGKFWRFHWYKENKKFPIYKRVRINSAEAVLDERWGKRGETKGNGLIVIESNENLFQIEGAELYTELWGGHPGTGAKRVTVNGRSIYQIPRNGTEDGHCTYGYPQIPLKINDLVSGNNAFQWNVEKGTTFWAHAFLNDACLRVALKSDHPDLIKTGLNEFKTSVVAEALESPEEGYRLSMSGLEDFSRIAKIEFEAWYWGYDENGNRNGHDWHGFTKNRELMGHLGTVTEAPFQMTWDTSMLPAQKNVAIRARIYFKDSPNLVYLTKATMGLQIKDRSGISVHLYEPISLPRPFWSRNNKRVSCTFFLDEDPAEIDRAELYVKTWTGGAGEVEEYFTLNGQHFPVSEGDAHEIQNNRLSISPALLKKGKNQIELLSSTKHHGIEVIYPGPALMIRARKN